MGNTKRTNTKADARKEAREKGKPIHAIKGLAESGVAHTTVLAGALANAGVITSNAPTSVLSNPMEYIDDLSRLNPFWGGVALAVMCSTIGYYAVNAILWEFRKRNQSPETKSGIDYLNETLADEHIRKVADNNQQEQGHDKVPFVPGEKFIAAYKYLLMLVTADPTRTDRMETPTPAVLYQRMTEANDEQRAIKAKVYESFQMERYKDSPNFTYIKQKLERKSIVDTQRAVIKAQHELDHICKVIRDTRYNVFDDGTWNDLPLWAQYKALKGIHNQVISAIVNEDEKEPDQRLARDELDLLGRTLLLELEGAARSSEVKLAFDREVLKEQHALVNAPAPTTVQ
jgi:hypothetical protein